MAAIRIYTDENVNPAVAAGLRRRGVEAFSAAEASNLGLKKDYADILQPEDMKNHIEFL